jgi:hypothetical protein
MTGLAPAIHALSQSSKKQDADTGGIEREGDASRLLPGMTT